MKAHPELQAALESLLGKLEAKLSPQFQETLHAYIAGGIAVHFYCGSRYTEDVDASFSHRFLFDAREMQVNYTRRDGNSAVLYLDPNYNPSFSLLHPDFEKDSVALPLQTRRVQAHLLAPVDLAISKLSRLSNQDLEDILNLTSQGLITADKVQERAREAFPDYIGDLQRLQREIDFVCGKMRPLESRP